MIPGLGRSPREGNVNPLQYSCLGNPMESGVCYAIVSPWGCKESDMTERPTLLLFHFHPIGYSRWTLSNPEIALPDSLFSKILFPVCSSCLILPSISTVFLSSLPVSVMGSFSLLCNLKSLSN